MFSLAVVTLTRHLSQTLAATGLSILLPDAQLAHCLHLLTKHGSMPVASPAQIWVFIRTDVPLETEASFGGGNKTDFIKVSILLPISGRNAPGCPFLMPSPDPTSPHNMH